MRPSISPWGRPPTSVKKTDLWGLAFLKKGSLCKQVRKRKFPLLTQGECGRLRPEGRAETGMGLILRDRKSQQCLKQDRNVFLPCMIAWGRAVQGQDDAPGYKGLELHPPFSLIFHDLHPRLPWNPWSKRAALAPFTSFASQPVKTREIKKTTPPNFKETSHQIWPLPLYPTKHISFGYLIT